MKDRKAVKKTPRVKWVKIKAPDVWRPKALDEELKGIYLGKTKRDGMYGDYTVVMVLSGDVTYKISGTMAVQLFDSALLTQGDEVRVVWKGTKDIHQGTRTMKLFELYVLK